MKWSQLKQAGHFPTLVSAFLYFDFSFMAWTLLGALGAQIAAPESLGLSPQQKGLMVATPILSGAILRIALGLLVDRIGAKKTGILAQIIVMVGLTFAWLVGLKNFEAVLLMGLVLGFAGASFAVALPQAGRWYPPNMQGLVLGLAGAGNIGVVIDSLFAPRLAKIYGWQNVFGVALIPAILVFLIYIIFSRDAPGPSAPKKISDYLRLARDKDTHWFCFYYTVSFGGFVGLASSFIIFFKDQFALSTVTAGDLAALCTAVGTFSRPVGGGLADRFGGIRALHVFYGVAGVALIGAGLAQNLFLNVAVFVIACGAFGMANGAVFQLLPQRFGKDIGVMTGLVGCGGGIGGFLLAMLLGLSRQYTGKYFPGLFIFSGLCFAALTALGLVKQRWRATWGTLASARV
ncbi:MAG: MFS transporter [Verrucomicrobiota bacterium]|nr:MFS transporter [Verrucomicrobiota bacterium]